MKFKIEKTKKGSPALWEEGGGFTNTGRAIIIADPDGGAKKPVYVRRAGHLSNQHHSLFVVSEGDVIIKAFHHRKDFKIEIFKIKKFNKEDGFEYAICDPIAEYSNGEWDNDEIALQFSAAIEAAKEKATCYHCRRPHYAKIEEENN